jgi:predicted nucleic acid-binding protein
MIRIIVFDTNVLISALLAPKSPSSTALRRALRDDTVVYSDSTLAELAEKIHLP